MLGYKWFTDEELNHWDSSALSSLLIFGLSHPDRALTLAGFPWLADDLTREEWEDLGTIVGFPRQDNPVAPMLVDLFWVQDGVVSYERETIEAIHSLFSKDPTLALEFLEAPWVGDGITPAEGRATRFIKTQVELEFEVNSGTMFYSQDKKLIVDITLAMESPLEPAELRLTLESMRSMNSFLHRGIIRIETLAGQPWVRDGLTKEEKAFIISLESVARYREFFEIFIEEGQVLSGTVTLPHSRQINLFAVARPSVGLGEEVFETLRAGTATIEKFMELPWPNNNVVLLVEPQLSVVFEDYLTRGRYHPQAHYISILEVPDTQGNRGILYHELGHYYFNTSTVTKWLSEGAAVFLSSYVLHSIENVSLESRYNLAKDQVAAGCAPHGVTNITEWYEQSNRNWEEVKLCHYPLGELFLLDMYMTLGHEAVSSSLQDLYTIGETRDKLVGDEDIYRVFLSNTPPGMEDQFHEIYQRRHGGPTPDS